MHSRLHDMSLPYHHVTITLPASTVTCLTLQGNLRVCKECCEIFTEFRLGKVKVPEKANQPSDSMKSDHTPTSPHPSSLQVGAESSQALTSKSVLEVDWGLLFIPFISTPLPLLPSPSVHLLLSLFLSLSPFIPCLLSYFLSPLHTLSQCSW